MYQQKRPDVVVVGAGVMGCATAYWLSKAGLKVLVIEKESIACGASGVSAGMLESPPRSATDPLSVLARESYKLHRKLAEALPEESGIDTGYLQNLAAVPTFSPDEADSLKSATSSLKRSGENVRWLDNKQLLELEPRLNPAVLGGMVYPMEQVIAYRYVLALFKAAEKYGTTLMHGKVVGLERQGQKVASVTLASGEKIDTSVVVLSMGPWCQEADKWLGLHVPVYPVRGQILHLDVPGRQMNAVVMYGGMYIVRKADGTTLAGATEEHDSGFEAKTTEEGKQVLMEASLKMAPSLAEARIINHLAGLRPGSKDRIPIIGPIPGWGGIYLITGHFRSGLLLNTASSKAIAEMITTGQTSLSIDVFSPARFARE